MIQAQYQASNPPTMYSNLVFHRSLPRRRRQQEQKHGPASGASLAASKAKQQEIYAPASIASPSEFARYKRAPLASQESQHYAATSYRGPPDVSSLAGESSRTGRESALANLWERFGTLRRGARARWSARRGSASPAPWLRSATPVSGAPPSEKPPLLPLDPELYATGKRKLQAEAIYAEGQQAIDGNQVRRSVEQEIDETLMSEGETRTLLEEHSKRQPAYLQLVETLTNWINDELAQQRIIVRDLQEDLYDGQILGKLVEKLHQIKLDIVEVTQNEIAQRYKLRTVLHTINRILSVQARWARITWSVEGIHAKNMVEILSLLITLARYYQAPLKLPAKVSVRVLVVQKLNGALIKRSHEAQLTQPELNSAHQQLQVAGQAPNRSRDAFDALLELAPEKLALVKQLLVNFVNRHLNKINMSCFANAANQQLNPEQFSDGLLLVFLIASLEDYFVPLGNLFTAPPAQKSSAHAPPAGPTGHQEIDINNNDNICNGFLETALEPTSYSNTQPIHKLHNVNIAFQLMEEAGVYLRPQVRVEDVVNGDLKSVLRVLYALFSRYRHL